MQMRATHSRSTSALILFYSNAKLLVIFPVFGFSADAFTGFLHLLVLVAVILSCAIAVQSHF